MIYRFLQPYKVIRSFMLETPVLCAHLPFFKLVSLCIYISNNIPFPGFPLSHPFSSCFYENASLPNCPFPPQHPGIPLQWENQLSQDQGLFLLLMADNAILCYICGWSHRSLHVCSLVSSLFLRSWERGSGWLTMLFFLWGYKPLHPLQSFL